MNKPELGEKRDCPNCGARFYDLNKSPAHCPKCGHDFMPEALLKPRKPREEGADEEATPARPQAETTLAEADREQKGAKSKRKAGLDQEGDDSEEIEDDIDLDIDDDDDDTLLEDDEDDDDDGVKGIVGGGEDDEV